MKLAFFNEKAELEKVIDFILEAKPVTVLKINTQNFHAILPNYDDYAFIKIRLDNQSMYLFSENLEKIVSPLN